MEDSIQNLNRNFVSAFCLILPVLACAQTDEWAIRPPPGQLVLEDELRRLQKQQNDVIGEAAKAQAKGDYATAERDFRRACIFLGHDQSFQHLNLARLFDLTGEERRAWGEYRIVLNGDTRSYSSLLRDVPIVTLFGDLCQKYGTVAETQQTYGFAISLGAQEIYSGPFAFARNNSLRALAAAARTASAIHSYWTGNCKEFAAQIEMAVQADDQNWVARTWRAVLYRGQHRKADATHEAMIAEGLAGDKNREKVRRIRLSYKIVDEAGNLFPDPDAKSLSRPVPVGP